MRFLADENIPRDIVESLRQRGHDVSWVRSDAPGSPDDQVLEQATAERRVLVTLDTGFGELTLGAALPPGVGIILIRIRTSGVRAKASVVELIHARDDWAGHFSVVAPGRLRMSPLPRP